MTDKEFVISIWPAAIMSHFKSGFAPFNDNYSIWKHALGRISDYHRTEEDAWKDAADWTRKNIQYKLEA